MNYKTLTTLLVFVLCQLACNGQKKIHYPTQKKTGNG